MPDQSTPPLPWMQASADAVQRLNAPAPRREATIRASTPRERVNDALTSFYEWLAGGIGQVPGLSMLGFDPAGMAQQMQTAAPPSYAAPFPILGAPPRIANPIKAYHGSPHDFDKFSLDKIGTGEGAQAYGHGLYFAQEPDVSRGYRDSLIGRGGPIKQYDANMRIGRLRVEDVYRSLDERAAQLPVEAARREYDKLAALESLMQHGDVLGVRQAAKDGQIPQEALTWFEKEIAPKFKRGGKLYEVAIHVDPEALLDWDKPLSQQSSNVARAANVSGFSNRLEELRAKALSVVDKMRRVKGTAQWVGEGLNEVAADIAKAKDPASVAIAVKGIPSGFGVDNQGVFKPIADVVTKDIDAIVHVADPRRSLLNGQESGGGLVQYLEGLHGRGKAAEILRGAGVPGVKYLDQGSRAAGEGSRNYVMFDERLVEILRKYGLIPPSVIGARALSGDER